MKNQNDKKMLKFSPLYKVLTQKVGVNSEILLHHYDKEEDSKIIARFGAMKGGFTIDEAVEMMKDVIEYQKKLEKRNIPLPPIDEIVLEYNHIKDRAVITKTSPWTGDDVEKIIEHHDYKEDPEVVFNIIRNMLRIINPICQERINGWETEIGVDPRCSNFTIDSRGQMWFIDLFPPRHRKNGEPIIEWPEPKSEIGRKLGHFKHFDARGIVLCFSAQLARIKPEIKEEIERIIFEEIQYLMSKEECQEFISGFNKTPWIKLRKILLNQNKHNQIDLQKAEKVISTSLDKEIFDIDYNVYTLRELAMELAYCGIISKDELEAFFKKSHFEDELPLKKMIILQKKLFGFLKRL